MSRTPARYSAQPAVQVEEAISGKQSHRCHSRRGSRSCFRAHCCAEAGPGTPAPSGQEDDGS